MEKNGSAPVSPCRSLLAKGLLLLPTAFVGVLLESLQRGIKNAKVKSDDKYSYVAIVTDFNYFRRK
jgi:hypothetical protein